MFLQCVDNIDYDPSALLIYIHTNNNFDNTERILSKWVDKNRHKFYHVEYIVDDIPELRDKPGRKSEQDWYDSGGIRLKKLAEIRQDSLKYAYDNGCKYYFVCDIDNFFPPQTVKYCVEKDLPILSPMMVRNSGVFPNSFYRVCDPNGYIEIDPLARLIWSRTIEGMIKVDLVHCCYMIKTEYLTKGLSYYTDGVKMEYVTFSDSARRNNIPQYVTNEIQTLFDPTDNFSQNVNICRDLRYKA